MSSKVDLALRKVMRMPVKYRNQQAPNPSVHSAMMLFVKFAGSNYLPYP